MRSLKAMTAIILVFVFALPLNAYATNPGSSEIGAVRYKNEDTETTESTENSEPATEIDSTAPTEPTAPKLNGFVIKNGKKLYYIDGVMQKGFVRIKNHYYYFDKNGCMVTGFRKIGKHRFYFAKNGHMVTGFRKIGKHHYYFKLNGWMVRGLHKIGKYKYYFNSKGQMIKGIRKIGKGYYYFQKNGRMKKGFLHKKGKLYYYSKKSGKRVKGFYRIGKYTYYFNKKNGAAIKGFARIKRKGKSYVVYFDKNCRLKKGTFTVGKVEYKAEKKHGRIYSCRNLAKALCQLPEMPSGCEIVSWTMMANFAGVKINKFKAAKEMPKSRNPNKGFMGSPYMVTGDGLVVYPNGLKSLTEKYLHGFTNLTGCKLATIKNQLIKGKLVMVWVKGLIVGWSHTIALTGYDNKGFYFNDPYTGKKLKTDYKSFVKYWNSNGTMAMTY